MKSDSENVRQYFTRSAEAFDSLYSEEKLSPLMRIINRNFRNDIYERFLLSKDHFSKHKLNTALDIGCGSGRYAYALYQLGVKRIVGVDISQTMIDLAIKNTGKLPNAHATFKFACCDFFEFKTQESFDGVLAMGFFDYIREPIPVLEKMRTLSNHSVIASFPSISLMRTPLRKVRYYFKRCPVYFYRVQDIVSLASKAGFARHEIIKIKGSGMDYWVAFYK